MPRTSAPTTHRKARKIEPPAYAQFVRRVIRGYGKRVAISDEPELLEMVQVLDEFENVVGAAVHGWMASGERSWTDVGNALGVSRQAARQRWGRFAPDRAPAASD